MKEEIQDDIKSMIGYCHEYAVENLKEFGRFLPFGVYIDSEGDMAGNNYEGDSNGTSDGETIKSKLYEYYNDLLDNGEVDAFCIASDTQLQINEEGDKVQTIAMDIVHKKDSNIPIYFYSYKINDDGDVEFGESFAMERE